MQRAPVATEILCMDVDEGRGILLSQKVNGLNSSGPKTSPLSPGVAGAPRACFVLGIEGCLTQS